MLKSRLASKVLTATVLPAPVAPAIATLYFLFSAMCLVDDFQPLEYLWVKQAV